jgi:hypothetical protein
MFLDICLCIFSTRKARFAGFAFFIFEVVNGFHFFTFSAQFFVENTIVWKFTNVLLYTPVVVPFTLVFADLVLVSARLAHFRGLAFYAHEKTLPFAVQTVCAFYVKHTWVRGCINRT